MAARNVVILTTNGSILYGNVTDTEATIGANGYTTMTNAQHVAKWRTDPGGISTLAVVGPTHSSSRIGMKVLSSVIRNIEVALDTTAAADTAFALYDQE